MFGIILRLLCFVALFLLVVQMNLWFLKSGVAVIGFFLKAFLPIGIVLMALWLMTHPTRR